VIVRKRNNHQGDDIHETNKFPLFLGLGHHRGHTKRNYNANNWNTVTYRLISATPNKQASAKTIIGTTSFGSQSQRSIPVPSRYEIKSSHPTAAISLQPHYSRKYACFQQNRDPGAVFTTWLSQSLASQRTNAELIAAKADRNCFSRGLSADREVSGAQPSTIAL
jgi:hypothetical protein